MKITKRHLRRLVKEAQFGRFTGGAAPLDVPMRDSGPVPKDQLRKLADIYMDDMGMSPEEVLEKPEFVEQGITDLRQLEENKLKISEGKMRVTERQLRRIIKEAIDVINAETGELRIFADEGDPAADGFAPDAPELAARNVMKRLGLTPVTGEGPSDREPGVEEIYLSPDDWDAMDAEIGGKRHKRKAKKERDRLNIDNLLARVDQWADNAGGDYGADNPGTDMQGVARDLALGAEFEFREDEWDALINHFDDLESFHPEDDLITYIADRIAG